MYRTLSFRVLIISVVALIVIFGGAFTFSRVRSQPQQYNGTLLDDSGAPQEFTLKTAGDVEVSLSDYRGKPVAIYFGYTHCPDVCPTTLLKLRNARSLLNSSGKDVQIMMISVDPARDSPATVQAYVDTFDPSFVGLSGSLDDITLVATKFGIFFQNQDVDSAAGYLVDHTSTVVVLDGEGRFRLLLPFDLDSQELADDLANLV